MRDTLDIDEELEAYLAGSHAGEVDPAHRKWMTAQIEKAMSRKARGDANYTPLDEVRKEFGL